MKFFPKSKKLEYAYIENDILHIIQAKKSQNSKIGQGAIIQTYHFSIAQVISNNLKLDSKNCKDCRFSFNQNNGVSGGCYTHKGMQLMGLKSMLKRLHKQLLNGLIKEFSFVSFDEYLKGIKEYKFDLVRFGAYGEPSLLDINVMKDLINYTNVGRRFTGYTHQWHAIDERYSKFLMASTHSNIEAAIAKDKGYRSFIVGSDAKGVNCPASKESKANSSCIKCAMCSGTTSKVKEDIYILQH